MKLLLILVLSPVLALAGDPIDAKFDWLVGCWVTPDKSAQEVWIAESDGSLTGFAVAIDNNAVGFYEVLRIDRNDDDSWSYTAYPSGQEPASFLAVEISETSVVFANPQHDYPQEIRYAREGNRLFATISLVGGGNPNSFDKVACDED